MADYDLKSREGEEEGITLDDDIREEVDRILLRRCREAVDGAQDRDDDLAMYDDQLNGRGLINELDRPAWHHPLTKKAHLQWLANVQQALQIDPLVQVDAVNPDDADEAQRLEEMLSDAMRRDNLRDKLLDAAYLCGRDPSAVMYVGWAERFRARRLSVPYTPQGVPFTQQEVPQPGYENELIQPHNEEVTQPHYKVSAGFDIQTPDLADFYLFPANVQSLEQAVCCFTRELMTAEDLVNGTFDFAYDIDTVEEMLKAGPDYDAQGNSLRDAQDDYDGVSDNQTEDGFYECFRCYSVLPRVDLGDGKDGIPEEYRGLEMVAMLAPKHHCVFKLDYCPYDERPYVRFCMGRIPNRFQGEGHCQLLDGLQSMANSVGQNFFDNMDYETTPVIAATPEWIQRYGTHWTVGAGKTIPRETPGQWEPVVWPKNSRDILSEIQLIEGQSDALTSAPGYGQLSPKVRRVAEMQQVVGETDAKFSLRLQIFFTALSEVAAKMTAYHYKYVENNDIPTAAIRERFLFTPVTTAQLATPESRTMQATHKVALQAQYLQMTMMLPPIIVKRVWHAYRSAYQAIGERRPEDFLGPEPLSQEWIAEQPPPAPIVPGMGAPGGTGAPPQMGGGPQAQGGGGLGGGKPALMGAPPSGAPVSTPAPIPGAQRNGAAR